MVRLRDIVGHSQTYQGFRSMLNLLTHAFKFPFILNIIFKLESQLPHTTLTMNEMFYTCTSDGSFILVTDTPSTLFTAESTWVRAITLCSMYESPVVQAHPKQITWLHGQFSIWICHTVLLSVNCNHNHNNNLNVNVNHNTNTNITNTTLTLIDPQATQGVKILMAVVTETVRAQYDSISSHWYVFFFVFFITFFLLH